MGDKEIRRKPIVPLENREAITRQPSGISKHYLQTGSVNSWLTDYQKEIKR